MLPKIKKTEFRNFHINDDIYTDNDIFLTPAGFETTETSRTMSKKDLEKMMLHEPEIIVFGRGFKNKDNMDKKIEEAIAKNNVTLHQLSTPDAVKKYQELARKGKRVVAKLHITC